MLPRLHRASIVYYVEDVARAFVKALDDSHTHGRVYELCGPEIYSLGEVVEFIRRQQRLKRWIMPLPKPLGRLQAVVADYLLPGKPFSVDNFESLSVAGVCSENGFASFGIAPKSMATVVPGYLRTRPRTPTTGLPSGPGQ